MLGEIHREERIKELAKSILLQEALQVEKLAGRVGTSFVKVVDLLVKCKGKIIFTGIGKTGHIASKLSATFASTGSPSFFVHAAEAAHGDLGMISKEDVVIAVSYSGSSSEILRIVPAVKRLGVCLISFTGSDDNPLSSLSDINLNFHVEREACPLNLAPTSSTTCALALGDALAIACLTEKGFSCDDFARTHPGGALGRKLLTRVKDIMKKGDEIPLVLNDIFVSNALKEIGKKRMGMTCVVDQQNRLVGIFTEGDLRRLIDKVGDVRKIKISDVMTTHPVSINEDEMAVMAAKKMEDSAVNQLIVLSEKGELVGAVHFHDLLEAKVL